MERPQSLFRADCIRNCCEMASSCCDAPCLRSSCVHLARGTQAMHRNATDLPCIMGRASALAAIGGASELHTAQDDAALLRQLAFTWVPARVVAALVVASAGSLEEANVDVNESGQLLEVGGQASMRGYEACVLRAQDAVFQLARRSVGGRSATHADESSSSVAGERSPVSDSNSLSDSDDERSSSVGDDGGAAVGREMPTVSTAEGKSPALSSTVLPITAPSAAGAADSPLQQPAGASSASTPAGPVTPSRRHPPRPAPLGLYPCGPLPHLPGCPAAAEAIRITLSLADPEAAAKALAASAPVGVAPDDEVLLAAASLHVPLPDPADLAADWASPAFGGAPTAAGSASSSITSSQPSPLASASSAGSWGAGPGGEGPPVHGRAESDAASHVGAVRRSSAQGHVRSLSTGTIVTASTPPRGATAHSGTAPHRNGQPASTPSGKASGVKRTTPGLPGLADAGATAPASSKPSNLPTATSGPIKPPSAGTGAVGMEAVHSVRHEPLPLAGASSSSSAAAVESAGLEAQLDTSATHKIRTLSATRDAAAAHRHPVGDEEKKEEEEASATAASSATTVPAAEPRPEVVFRRMENWLVWGDPRGGIPAASVARGAVQDAWAGVSSASLAAGRRQHPQWRRHLPQDNGDVTGEDQDDDSEDREVDAALHGGAGHSGSAEGSATHVLPPLRPKASDMPVGEAEGLLAAPRSTGGGVLQSSFDPIEMTSYGGGYRGVTMSRDVPANAEILAVDRRCIITVEHGKRTQVGQRMLMADPPLRLSAAKHCYTAVFLLLDQEAGGSFFQPYYDVLPKSFPSMPLFWDREQLAWLRGSHLLAQVADRKRNLESDYREICRVSPDFARFSLHRFTVARMVVASRNFGIVVDGRKTDAMVPYADMLNHLRPRETRWTFNRHRQVFTIHSITPLRKGDQVFDSYGRKCNSRFLLNYGFTAEDNRDAESGRSLDELLVRVAMPPPQKDAWWTRKRALLDGGLSVRGIRVAAWNAHAGTRELFGFLRFAVAQGDDVSRLPYIGKDAVLGQKPIPPLSLDNECRTLQALCAVCEDQLAGYERPAEHDLAELCSGTCQRGSNRRNALVLLLGEKSVARHFIRLAQVAVPLLAASPDELAGVARSPVTEDSEINAYVRTVVRPLVSAAAARYYGMTY